MAISFLIFTMGFCQIVDVIERYKFNTSGKWIKKVCDEIAESCLDDYPQVTFTALKIKNAYYGWSGLDHFKWHLNDKFGKKEE